MVQDHQDNNFILLYCMNGKIQYPASLRLYAIPLQDVFLLICFLGMYVKSRNIFLMGLKTGLKLLLCV